MKKGMTWIIVAVLVVIIAIGAYFYFSNPAYNQNTNTNTNTNPSANAGVQTQVPPNNAGSSGTDNIAISGFAFSPTSLTIHAGDTVVWTNQDYASHTIVSDDGTSFTSPSVAQGQTYSHTFTTPGNFSYHCSIHPGMRGIIIVQ
jgi:plastocyanin